MSLDQSGASISIKMYPARNGDAFLVTCEGENPATILIDGGYEATVQEHMLPDLRHIAESGRSVDLVVATHVDADHVSGLLYFFGANGLAADPRIVAVRDVWHNSLRSIRSLGEPVAAQPPEGRVASTAAVGNGDSELLLQIRRRGYPPPSARSGAAADIGARQGSSLAALLLGGGYRWNGGEGEIPVVGAPSDGRRDLNSETYLTILGPPHNRLQALAEWWVRELRRQGFTGVIEGGIPFDDAFEFLAASGGERTPMGSQQISANAPRADAALTEMHILDTSPTNASSISFILHSGPYRALFLADAWAEDIEAALPDAMRVGSRLSGPPVLFDAIKIAHHGSRRNTSPALLGLIDSPRFLISSSGERHNHPDIEVLRAIVDRPAPFLRELFFNYPTAASEAMKTYISRAGAAFAVSENAREIVIKDGAANQR